MGSSPWGRKELNMTEQLTHIDVSRRLSIHLNCWICCHIIVHSIPLFIFCISVVFGCYVSFSFLILFIWVFSLFFLASLVRGLSINLVYPFKEPVLGFTDFLPIFKSLIYSLIFIISFLLLTLGFFALSFSNSFKW